MSAYPEVQRMVHQAKSSQEKARRNVHTYRILENQKMLMTPQDSQALNSDRKDNNSIENTTTTNLT